MAPISHQSERAWYPRGGLSSIVDINGGDEGVPEVTRVFNFGLFPKEVISLLGN